MLFCVEPNTGVDKEDPKTFPEVADVEVPLPKTGAAPPAEPPSVNAAVVAGAVEALVRLPEEEAPKIDAGLDVAAAVPKTEPAGAVDVEVAPNGDKAAAVEDPDPKTLAPLPNAGAAPPKGVADLDAGVEAGNPPKTGAVVEEAAVAEAPNKLGAVDAVDFATDVGALTAPNVGAGAEVAAAPKAEAGAAAVDPKENVLPAAAGGAKEVAAVALTVEKENPAGLASEVADLGTFEADVEEVENENPPRGAEAAVPKREVDEDAAIDGAAAGVAAGAEVNAAPKEVVGAAVDTAVDVASAENEKA